MKIDDDGSVRFPTATRVVGVLKIAAAAVVVITALVALGALIHMVGAKDFRGDPAYQPESILLTLLADVVGGVLIAAFFGFFAYVLEILIEIYSLLWALSDDLVSDADA